MRGCDDDSRANDEGTSHNDQGSHDGAHHDDGRRHNDDSCCRYHDDGCAGHHHRSRHDDNRCANDNRGCGHNDCCGVHDNVDDNNDPAADCADVRGEGLRARGIQPTGCVPVRPRVLCSERVLR